ncbi:hypothetical protein [Romboutsia sp.]|uniref:hypothetical protein n=1 Tax=Romboutsia sp. TaxID=1965302 RepID=UPI003F3DECBE
MEYILGAGILALLGRKFIKNIMDSIVFIAIIVISVAVTMIYKLPYIVSLSICVLVKYGLKDFITNLRIIMKSMVKSKRRYYNGYLQKLVYILIDCNYLLFTLLCYMFLAKEIIHPVVTFSSEEAIVVSVVVVISIKIIRKILDKITKAVNY